MQLERYMTDFGTPGLLKWIRPEKHNQIFLVDIPGTSTNVNITVESGDIGFALWAPTTYGYVAFGNQKGELSLYVNYETINEFLIL